MNYASFIIAANIKVRSNSTNNKVNYVLDLLEYRFRVYNNTRLKKFVRLL